MKYLTLALIITLSSCGGGVSTQPESDPLIDELDFEMCEDQGGELQHASGEFICVFWEDVDYLLCKPGSECPTD